MTERKDTFATLDVAAIRARADAATPGPWGVSLGSGNNVCTWVRYENPENGKITFVADCLPDSALDCAEPDHRANMFFIEHAREDVPALCDEVERLREALKMVRRVLKGEETPEDLDHMQEVLASE